KSVTDSMEIGGRGLKEKISLKGLFKETGIETLVGIARRVRARATQRAHYGTPPRDYSGPNILRTSSLRAAAEEVARFVLNTENIPNPAVVEIIQGVLEARNGEIEEKNRKIEEGKRAPENVLYSFTPKSGGRTLKVIYAREP
ncbi:MAG TPA: hypothetical protein VHB73_07350, partial [Alphaproteobacteria bacterium]|nr:hypothetical protein [Alphaproteobacteria bacterium]